MKPEFENINLERDKHFLRTANEAARRSVEKGNCPFGAVLVDKKGNVVAEQENLQVTTGDKSAHAEIALIRDVTPKYDADFLWGCTIYTNVEPCLMCAAGIYWANIGRIVFALDEPRLIELGAYSLEAYTTLSCRTPFENDKQDVIIHGPIADPELEKEVAEVCGSYDWNKYY